MRLEPALCTVFLTASVCFSSLAQATPLTLGRAMSNPPLVVNIGCKPNDEDKQGACMQACEDAWIRGSSGYTANSERLKTTRKACEAACGC